MPAGQVIGRVSVRVLPDTDQFRRQAQKDLDRIEKQLEVKVQAKIDLTSGLRDALTELRRINQENRTNDGRKMRIYTTIATSTMDEEITKALRKLQEKADGRKLQIHADLVGAVLATELDEDSLRQVEHKLKDWASDISPLKIPVRVDFANGAGAAVNARLAVLTRPRTVPIIPKVNHTALASAATALAALSGARAVGNLLDGLWQSIKNLDKAAPIIGGLALAIAGLSGVGIAAASNLATLSASLASIAPAALGLPGLLGGFAIGLGAAIVAFKDFNKVIPEVKGQLTALKATISTNFWAAAEQPIRSLIDTLLPQFSAGMAKVSTELGGFFGGLATALKGSFNGALAGMFAGLSSSIDIATGATGALANSIKILGETGASYLPALAKWFVSIATRFNAWLTEAAADGRLKAWIDTALAALQDLGTVLSSVGKILAGIAAAAEQAGGSSLNALAGGLQYIAEVVRSPAFQSGLVGVFGAAHTAMNLIATQSGPAVENLFSQLATTLQTVLPMAGQAIGQLLGAVADALASPAVQGGIVDLFRGIQTAVQALAPAIGPVGQAFGALASVLGTFIATLGPTLATVFTALANAVTTLAPALQPLISTLGGALSAAMTALAPVIAQVAGALASMISGGLVPALTSAFTALAPVISSLGGLLGTVLVTALQAITPLLPVIAQLIAAIAPVIAQLLTSLAPIVQQILAALGPTLGVIVQALTPLITMLLQLITSILTPILTALGEVIAAALPRLGEALARVAQSLQPFLQALQAVVDFLMPYLVPAIKWVATVLVDSLIAAIDGVADIFTGVVEVIKGLWNILAGIFTGDWSRVWEGVKQVFTGIWDIIVGAFNVIINVGILGVAKKGLALLKGAWDATWTGIKALVDGIWAGLKNAWSAFTGALGSIGSSALSGLKSLFSTAWTAIKEAAGAAWSAIKAAFSTGVNNAITVVNELPGKAKSALGDLGAVLVSAGVKLIQGLINGIKSMFGKVKGALGDLTSKLTDWKGPASTDRVLLVDAGQLVIEGFLSGLESRYAAVRKSLAGFTREIGAMTIQPPSIAGFDTAGLAAQVTGALNGTGQAGVTKVLNYYAAPNNSLDSEEDLFAAASRARMVGW